MLRYFLPLFCSLLFFSCGSDSVFEEINTFEEDEWTRKDTAIFNFTIKDTAQTYNIYYDIRYDNEYPFYNLYVKQSLLDSAGNPLLKEQQEMILFDRKTGQPLGSGFGNIYDHRVLSRRNFTFPYAGDYTFSIEQYMRKDTLPGVSAIGIAIKQPVKQQE